MPSGICLDGREYKLLLKPACVDGDHGEATANRFLEDLLRPAVRRATASGVPDIQGNFELDKRRTVRFYDTERHLLSDSDFILRKRVDVVDGKETGDHEITLKFRTTDMYLAAGTEIPGTKPLFDKKNKPKKAVSFEEDIAPLQVTVVGTSGTEQVVAADPPSIRSRFAKSSKQLLETGAKFATLRDVFRHFRTLPEHLGHAGAADGASLPITPGPLINEWVFDGPGVDLTNDHQAKFALTLWYVGGAKTGAPDVAEISFEVEMSDGDLPPESARLALELFVAMQNGLPVNRDAASKTALAQP